MTLDLSAAGTLIYHFFGKTVNAVARQTKFVQRASKLTGQLFLQAIVFAYIQKPTADLADIAQGCTDLGVPISPQGVDQRINAQAMVFVQEMFRQAMTEFKNKLPLPLPILQQFSALNLVDSSVVALPAQLQADYPGCGGNGPQASLKFQMVFEFLYGNLQQLIFQAGRAPDQKYQAYLSVVQPGSLTLMDLGYFCLDSFKAIMATPAYVLSRFLPQTGLLTSDGQPLALLAWLQAQPGPSFDLEVQVGQQAKHHLPCRLLGLRLPQELADRRRQKAKDKARRTHKVVTQAYLATLDWTLFVTNVPSTMLTLEQVAVLYRVRWQIELVFKLWKSYAGLKRVAGWRKERVLVEVYAKLIGLVLTHFLVAPFRFQRDRELSPVKVREILARFGRDLARHLAHLPELVTTMAQLARYIQRFGFKEKRTKQPNVCRTLELISVIYELELDIKLEMDLPPLLA
jgi:hypothetical protein